jgi:hypothetical protein
MKSFGDINQYKLGDEVIWNGGAYAEIHGKIVGILGYGSHSVESGNRYYNVKLSIPVGSTDTFQIPASNIIYEPSFYREMRLKGLLDGV